MKKLGTFQKLVALFVAGAILSLGYVVKSKAFTLVDLIVPAVQLGPSQELQVIVSNITDEALDSVTVNIVNAGGTVVMTKTFSLAANQTIPIVFQNGATAASYSANVTGGASTIVADVAVLGSNGEVDAALPYITPGTSLYTPALQFLGGQTGAVTITNPGSTATQYELVVIARAGTTAFTRSGGISAGQTLTFTFTHGAAYSPTDLRAVVTTTGGAVVSDIMAFDMTTNTVIAILPAVQ
ncbi:MAG TPA: hypothetical protein VEI26_08500 [Terriglobales bacterium]|nr:hypothetical protein [Terriglobales bacterium]